MRTRTAERATHARPQSAVCDPRASASAVRSAIRGAIEFRDLVFSYGDTPVLNHVSATIAAGQTVALVGVTGPGKSTLISLLARLHDPPPGTVFIDGVDVRDMPLATLRGAIGFVPQEPFLFSDTLADNVAFGMDATSRLDAQALEPAGDRRDDARARSLSARARRADPAAAAVARLDKDVADFPKGYDTMVGERGITLSGGQKQRTALARAVAIDPRILILDDALSAVDTYTEEEILSRLRGVMRERTSIIVSHRISTVRDADLHLRARRGAHRRTRHARGADPPQRPLRRAAQEAVAGRGARGVLMRRAAIAYTDTQDYEGRELTESLLAYSRNPLLLVSQRDERIHARRPQRRDGARRQRDDRERRSGNRVGRRIDRARRRTAATASPSSSRPRPRAPSAAPSDDRPHALPRRPSGTAPAAARRAPAGCRAPARAATRSRRARRRCRARPGAAATPANAASRTVRKRWSPIDSSTTACSVRDLTSARGPCRPPAPRAAPPPPRSRRRASSARRR